VNLRMTAFRFAIVAAALLTPLLAHAECIGMLAKSVMEQKDVELVFSGTVVEVIRTADLGYRATFDVDRVWKGFVSKRIDLYVWELAPEISRFENGHRYVAVAKQLTDKRARQGAGLGGSEIVAFTPVQCSDSATLGPDFEKQLGTGLPPQ
jgi:hypothetical protein